MLWDWTLPGLAWVEFQSFVYKGGGGRITISVDNWQCVLVRINFDYFECNFRLLIN